MVDCIFQNAIVVTMADSLGCGVIQDGAVAVKGNCIISVGETAEILKKYSAHRYIDGRGKLLMPGLIDATRIRESAFSEDMPRIQKIG